MQMGINTHDFTWDLKPGESFASPEILCGYSADGFQTMSHNLHQFANDFLLREGLRPVLYNSWEATGFDVTVQEQKKLAAKAKELGAELFVVDDGWFGQRHGIDNGLGDWYVNKEKFPNGIDELIDEVKAAMSGMLSPELKQQIIGLAEVRDVFKSPKFGAIAGCMVTEGVVKRHNPIRVLRDNVVIYEGELESLRRFKDDVNEVRNGMECGIGVKNYNDVRTGDVIEVFEIIEIQRTIA